jgi:hypothetical protein
MHELFDRTPPLAFEFSLEFLLAASAALLLAWLFGVGASVGSFLNVVAYRLPLRINLIRPSSRCPHCGHRIRLYDNLPVLGWFFLRGKCRDCRGPISFRYPLVEMLMGTAFVLVALGELFFVPHAEGVAIAGTRPALTTWEPWPLWLAYGLHVLLVSTLIGAALVDYDGHAVPRRLFAPVLTTGLILPLLWPELRRWPAFEGMALSGWQAGLADGLCGLAAGAAAGMIIGTMFRLLSPPRLWPPFAPECVFASVGVVMGWQWAVVVAAGSLVYWCSVPLASAIRGVRLPIPLAAVTAAIVLLAILVVPLAPGAARWIFSPLSAAVLALLLPQLAFIAAVFAPRGFFDRPKRVFPLQAPLVSKTMPTNQQRTPQQSSPSFILAYEDEDFLRRPELRPVRMQLELLKPEMILAEQNVRSTIVVFGSTQITERPAALERLAAARQALTASPDDPALARAVARAERLLAKCDYYDAAREFGRISSCCQLDGRCDYVVMTGGGPGIMEAANRGACDAGAKSIGLNITLPQEQHPNQYITPELCFQFHYFALRKMHFLLRAKALVVFPGGFGTMDELFEVLTLRQTSRMQEIPVILFGRAYWEKVINFQFLADEGVIADEHLKLIQFAESAQEAWDIIARFHNHAGMPQG